MTRGEARDLITRRAGYPDLRGCVALTAGNVVGVGCGTRSEPGTWWHDRVAARLHDALLAAQPCPRALLPTQVDNAPARRFSERRGWRYPHPGFVVGGNPPYAVMGKAIAAGR
ncbi:MAG: hypothetical protein M3Q65_20500 [Chloroflexota bacterium]|nr:hypothetical protein [Chloroflexota bacterium]